MKILVLGGDGFCGWPTSLYLSNHGHDVTIVDNLSRRNIENELEAYSLTPIQPIGKRLATWQKLTGKRIGYYNFDIARNYHRLLTLLREWHPDAVVHFAEQRAAPYSMKSSWHKCYTVSNNLNATNNLLAAIVESRTDPHVVHLGTMGVYGYGAIEGVPIPEGYLRVHVDAADGSMISKEILYPPNPGSIYHLTKTQDQLFFAFYNKNDNIRITDLHQGIVWGTQTDETQLSELLINRFDYDGDYGTVLNRFLVEAVVGHPLTVHGSGEQTRAFIHIRDTVACVELAIENPPQRGERVRIINQMTEVHRIIDLADQVARFTGARIERVRNPRKEQDRNSLAAQNDTLLELGLHPTMLETRLMEEVADIVKRYADRVDLSKIPCRSQWVQDCDDSLTMKPS